MKKPLLVMCVKSLCLAMLVTATLWMGSRPGKAAGCEACVQLESGGEIWYGCAAWGHLGHTECIPLDDHCGLSGHQCDPGEM